MTHTRPADVLINGLWKESPVFRLVLGMCPVLAVTTQAGPPADFSIDDPVEFLGVKQVAEFATEKFLSGEYDHVKVAFTNFTGCTPSSRNMLTR